MVDCCDCIDVLWNCIIANTDEMYEVAEKLRPTWIAVAEALMRRSGIEPKMVVGHVSGDPVTALLVGLMKDPVRIAEKAWGDYYGRFPEKDIATACVVDVLRARAICTGAEEMIKLIEMLKHGIELRIDDRSGTAIEVQQGGELVTITLVRAKNKFASVDPSHVRRDLVHPASRVGSSVHARWVARVQFRNVLNNLLLTRGTDSIFVEMQVHHVAIYSHNYEMHSHDHYTYFRRQLGEGLDRDLDPMLERMMLFLDEVRGVPGESAAHACAWR